MEIPENGSSRRSNDDERKESDGDPGDPEIGDGYGQMW